MQTFGRNSARRPATAFLRKQSDCPFLWGVGCAWREEGEVWTWRRRLLYASGRGVRALENGSGERSELPGRTKSESRNPMQLRCLLFWPPSMLSLSWVYLHPEMKLYSQPFAPASSYISPVICGVLARRQSLKVDLATHEIGPLHTLKLFSPPYQNLHISLWLPCPGSHLLLRRLGHFETA